jgi:phosphate transport system substrate-binding protein
MVLTALLAAGLIGCGGGGSGGGGGGTLQGAGSSFIDPMMQEWATAYYKAKQVKLNYQSKGSTAGIDMMTHKDVDFGCTDAPMTDEQLSKAKEAGGEVIHVPLLMGAIVPAYNLEGNPDLNFSGEVIGRIYLGKIKKWNDPAIKALNPEVDLPDLDIVPVRRSDGSGSTYILTDFLHKVLGDEWKPGVSTAIEWPAGNGQKGNDGVAGLVKRTNGAFGYIELIYALKNNISFGAVKNSKGKRIKADMKSVTAAAAAAEVPADLRYSITNAAGDDAYPISGTTWAVLYVKQPPDKAAALHDFLHWITHDGQEQIEKLHYARLPEGLVKKVDEKLALLKGGK